MHVRHELHYDAPPDRVAAMLADPAFREEVCAAQDVVSATVTVTPGDAGPTVTVDQVQRTAGLPAVAKKFAGDTTRAVITEGWRSATTADLEIEAPGKPTTVRGTITLEPVGAGTTEVVDLEVRVTVPLVGGKLEKLMAEQITAGYEVEQGVGRAWLEESR